MFKLCNNAIKFVFNSTVQFNESLNTDQVDGATPFVLL